MLATTRRRSVSPTRDGALRPGGGGRAVGRRDGRRRALAGMSYEQGAAALRPERAPLPDDRGNLDEPTLERRRSCLVACLVGCGVTYDGDVDTLFRGETESLKRRGQRWRGAGHVLGFLHAHADREILRLKVVPEEVTVPVKCKAIAALLAHALGELEQKFDDWCRIDLIDDPKVFDGLVALLFQTVVARHGAATMEYYRTVANDRPRWRQMPPFLR